MKKNDVLASVIIGVISAIITIFILNFIELKLPLIGNYPLSLLFILPIGAVAGVFVAEILAKKIPVIFQVAKCFLAGVLNTLIDLGVLNLLMATFATFSGPLYPVFKGISFTAGTINSYFWNKYWTFEKKDTKPGVKEFGTLYIVTGIGFLLNVGIASLINNIIGPQFGFSQKVWASLAAVIATFIVFVWNFSGYKFVVFKK